MKFGTLVCHVHQRSLLLLSSSEYNQCSFVVTTKLASGALDQDGFFGVPEVRICRRKFKLRELQGDDVFQGGLWSSPHVWKLVVVIMKII